MNEMFKYLQKLPSPISVMVLIIALIFLIISKWDSISKSLKRLSGKTFKNKRTCGDCVLILFGIREKYEYQSKHIDNNLLRMQMKFAEQKIQEAIFFLSQSFSDDIKVMGDGVEHDRKVTQAALYCEALKNGILSAKDEIRRSIKENGFENLSENEYSHYVKDKTRTIITIIRSYLNQYSVQHDKTIVNLKERFKRMDGYHIQKFESWVFDIFSNAKDLALDSRKRRVQIQENLKLEIDNFVKHGDAVPNC